LEFSKEWYEKVLAKVGIRKVIRFDHHRLSHIIDVPDPVLLPDTMLGGKPRTCVGCVYHWKNKINWATV
jgi:hypothetical protein